MRYHIAVVLIVALVALAATAALLGVMTGTSTGAGFPSAASYGQGPFAFAVYFLTKPAHDFHRERRNTNIVAVSRYQAQFSSGAGTGTEIAAVVQLVHRPSSTCQVVRTLLRGPTVKCPTSRTRNRKIPPGTDRVTVFRTVVRCPVNICEGYAGSVAILQAKMLYYVGLSDASRATVEKVIDSLST